MSSKKLVNMSTKVSENILTADLWTSRRIYRTRTLTVTVTGAVHQNVPKLQKIYLSASVYMQFWR